MPEPDSPAPRAKGRPTLDQAGRIDGIIREAALHVLFEHGEAATLNAVALAAGVSRKSLYARYRTKADLFLAVVRDLLADPKPIAFARGASFEESLNHYIVAALGSVVAPGAQAVQRLMILNPHYFATLRSEMIAAMQTIFADPLHRLLQDGAAAGDIVLEEAHVDMAVDSITRLIVLRDLEKEGDADPGGAGWTERHARFLTAFVCRGLLPR